MEPFLPSEVARLVYGYLDEAKCDEAAQSFLEQSPHLSECLSVYNKGKGFNTRPAGYSLSDILNEYCEIRNMVAERLQRLPENSAEKLRQCGSLIGQLRYLIEATRSGQTLLVSITVPPQGSSVQGNSSSVTSVISSRNRTRTLGSSERVKRAAVRLGQDIKQQHSNDANDRIASTLNSMLPVEATPLESLPGLSRILDNQCMQTARETGNAQDCDHENNVCASGQTEECEHIDQDDSCSRTSPVAGPSKPSSSSSSQCRKCCNKGRTLKYQQPSCTRTRPVVDSLNSSPIEDALSCSSTPKQKHLCSSKRKSSNPTPVKSIHTPVKSQTPCKARRSHSDDNDSSESLDFSIFTRALLDNKELHEKIAENINRVIRMPGPEETLENVESHPSTSAAAEPSDTETSPVVTGSSLTAPACDGMLHELNQAIKTIVDQTEQDPLFERFLEEIIGPLDEEMTPSPAEMQSEGDDAVTDIVDTSEQLRNIGINNEDNISTPNRKSSPGAIAGCSRDQQQFQEEQKQDQDNADNLNNDVPLKQRLRSARQRASGGNSVSPTTPPVKEKKKEEEGTSLEDQNAAAIQCIVDAKISSQKISEVSRSHQPQKNDVTSVSISTTHPQTINTASSIYNSQENPGHSSQPKEDSSPIVSSLQKEINQISDTSEGNAGVGSSSNAIQVANGEKHDGEVILFDGNLTFMDSNTSIPLSTETGSNFVLNTSPLKSHLTAPLLVASQPSVSTASTSHMMEITISGTTDALQQAATLSGISLHPPPLPQAVATTSMGQVVAIIPGSQNVNNSMIHEQDLMSMSTVIMCGNDGMVPQFISLPQQDSSRGSYLLSGSGGSRYVPIAPRDSPLTTTTTSTTIDIHQMGAPKPQQIDVCQSVVMMNRGPSTSKTVVDPKPGKSKQAKSSKSKSSKHSSTDEKKRFKNKVGVWTRSQVNKTSTAMGITLYANDSREDVKVTCSNTGQKYSTDSALSLPTIILESPQVKMSSTTGQEDGVVTSSQEEGREKLLGTLNLKETSDSPLNPSSDEIDKKIKSKSSMEVDKNKSTKSKSEFLLQNVDKYPPSPRLLSLVNLSKSNILANGGCSPLVHIPGIDGETFGNKHSENKLTQKPRGTPQAMTSQGRTGVNSKRMSLSTPRRQRHVRALDFTTPPKARSVPKVSQHKRPSPKTSEKLPNTTRRNCNDVNKVRSTLFKSPQNEPETTAGDLSVRTAVLALSSASSDNSSSNIPPIATRSPAPRLSGGWDNAAGVGQIICVDTDVTKGETKLGDAIEPSSSEIDNRDEMNQVEKQSEVIKKSTSLLEGGKTGYKETSKLAEGSLTSDRVVLSCPKKTWDSDLRSLLKPDYEDPQLLTDDNDSTTVNITKKKGTRTTKSRRKSSQVTEEEVRRLEECLNEDNMDNGSTIANQGSTISETISSSSDIPVDKSVQDSEETDLNSEAKNQIRNLNTGSAGLDKGKTDVPRKNVEQRNESELELVKKLSVKSKSKSKRCVPLDKLNDEKSGVLDDRGDSDQVGAFEERDGKDEVTNVQRRENLTLEVADSNEVDLSGSSDSSTVSPSVLVGSVPMTSSSKVMQSPTKLKTAKRTIVHHNLQVCHSQKSLVIEENLEMSVAHTDDPGNDDTNSIPDASGTGCELKDRSTASGENITDDQPVSVSQSQDLVSSTSGFYPSESQNKDSKESQHYKSIFNKESYFANLPDKKMSGKQRCNMVNRSDPQPKSVTVAFLDTPRKTDDPGSSCWGTDYMPIPLTPRVLSPHPDDTPITKVVNGSCCVDFSLIQTPSFPPTPNIAVTPQSCDSSQGTPSTYATRPTDYSSCSSYYKPSGEQDSSTSDKPLEQLLIDECRKLETNSVVRTSCANNPSHKEDAAEHACPDNGRSQALSVTDETFVEAAPSLPDCVTDMHFEKELVLDKANEGQVDSLIGGPTETPSPEKHGNNVKSKCAKRKARSLSRTANKSSDLEDESSERDTSTSVSTRKARSLSRTVIGSSDFEDKQLEAQTSASISTKRRTKFVSRAANKTNDFEDESPEAHASTSISEKKRGRSLSRINRGMKDEPSETHTSLSLSKKRKARSVSRTANRSRDSEGDPSEAHALTSVSTKKARSVLRTGNKSSDLSETETSLFKGSDEKTKDEIIKGHLDAARIKLFGCNSPSDDSDFESSNDFGQSEVEAETVSSSDGNNKRLRGLTKETQNDTAMHSSKSCRIYSDDSNTNLQQTVEPQRQPVNRLSVMKEKSPSASTWEEQIRQRNMDKEVICETPCHSEIFSEHHQSIDGFKKSSVLRNDHSVGTKLHTSHFSKPLSSELDEKKRRMIAKLKGIDVSSVPNSKVKEVEDQGRGMRMPSASVENNRDVDTGKQLKYKEQNIDKTAVTTPTKVIRNSGGQTTPAKKNLHLSVDAIADRLIREKIAVQAHPSIQTPVRRSQACEDSSSEDFPALHLSSDDDDTQSEHVSFSQVETQMAKLHGGEVATEDVLTIRLSPRPIHDVRKDLELTPNKLQCVQTDPSLLHTGNEHESKEQELECEELSNARKSEENDPGGMSDSSPLTSDFNPPRKKLNLAERQENRNKKIRALLGEDVSPIKNLTEVREAYKEVKHGILCKIQSVPKKNKSPVKNTVKTKSQGKLKKRSGISKAVQKVKEKENSSKQNKVKKTSRSHKTSNEVDDVKCGTTESVSPSIEGLSSCNTSMTYERLQVSENETYIGIVYADDGPKGNNLAFEDISSLSLNFELGEDSDGVSKCYKCTTSEFQELFCASPIPHTTERNSHENSQFDIKRKSTSVSCRKDEDCVKSDKELFQARNDKIIHSGHKSRRAGLYLEHRTKASSQDLRSNMHFLQDKRGTTHAHRRTPSPVRRRWTLSPNRGRRSQSLDRRSSSPVPSTSKMTTISPLNQLYSEYRDERKTGRFVSCRTKRGQDFNFRRNERVSFRKRGRGKAKYHDRHSDPQREIGHTSRESSHTSVSSHGMSDLRDRTLDPIEDYGPLTDKRSKQEVRLSERCSRKVLQGSVSFAGTILADEDMGKEPVTVDTPVEEVAERRQKMQETEELEEGELIEEDAVETHNKYKSYNDKQTMRIQKYASSVTSDDEVMPFSLVGSVRTEISSEGILPVLKGSTSLNGMGTDQALERNSRSVEDKLSQEHDKPEAKAVQKEASFSGAPGSRTLPPKKRKASSEDLSAQVEKRLRTDGPQALLKKVDLDHLLDFVHGEKPG